MNFSEEITYNNEFLTREGNHQSFRTKITNIKNFSTTKEISKFSRINEFLTNAHLHVSVQ